MNTNYPGRVLMIALDAAEPHLIEQWMADDTLPNLKRLRAQGVYGRLASSADWMAGSPWPTFYSGTTPADHGLYHFMQWQDDQMTYARPTPDWLPLRPFWRNLSDTDRRVVAFDIPMTFAPEPFDGVEISGWATHDRLAPPASNPPAMMDWLHQQFGLPPVDEEVYKAQPVEALFQLRDQLTGATERVTKATRVLMDQETWHLFMVGFGATHRGGHKLWDTSGILGGIGPEDQEEFSQALRDIYMASDTAVGRLVEAMDDDVTIIVFSLHGMGPNTNRTTLLPIMLNRILAQQRKTLGGSEGGDNVLTRFRKLIPLEWRDKVKSRLPSAWQDWLTLFWRVGNIDWSSTPAFSMEADLQGYIRINLKGREPAGIVEPGQEYDQLCEQIIDGLNTFVDADTGEPVIRDIIRSDHLFPNGSRRNNLPDLLVRWTTKPVANERAIVSPRYGSIPWPIPGHNPDGRSGNHRAEGFLLATGRHIQPNSHLEDAHILDLVPTIHALLDVPIPDGMRGRVLPIVQPRRVRSSLAE